MSSITTKDGTQIYYNEGMSGNDKGRCINPIQRPQIWCGEGDLNPHEIAPASTSS